MRGQKAIEDSDILNIPNVILGADAISRSEKDYNGKPAINFVKNSDNKKTTVTAVVSDKRLDLFVQTMFINQKKSGNLATPIDEQASINTPEANSGTVSNNKVSQPGDSVKVQKSERDNSVSDRELREAVQYYREQAQHTAPENRSVDKADVRRFLLKT